MSQEEVNATEWANAENWSGPKLLSVYFSKRDTRAWVPKQLPWAGWTVNLGRPAGVWWLIAILLVIALAPVVCVLAGVSG